MARRGKAVDFLDRCGGIFMVGVLLSVFGALSVNAVSSPNVAADTNITFGPGYTDVSPHQLIRTTSNILYTIAPTCDVNYPCIDGANQNTLRVFAATNPGIPTGYSEQDASHRPTGQIASSAIAVDGTDLVHVVYNDQSGSGSVIYRTFDTGSGHWNAPTTLDSGTNTHFTQGDEGVALALDAAGTPHVAWSSAGGGGPIHLSYANRTGGTWSAPITIDDGAVPMGNFRSLHPTVAFRADNTLVVSWLKGTFNYTPDGIIYVRSRITDGTWSDTTAIADLAMTTIDNGPSLLVTPDGTEHLTFVAANPPDQLRYWYNSGSGWKGDQQPPAQVTHDPSLGPDGAGGIFIYGHGTPTPFDGHGDNLYRFHKAQGGTWGAWSLYTPGSYDSSVTTRWSQFFDAFPQTLDIAYWSDTYPNTIMHVGSEIVGGGGETITPPPPTHPVVATLRVPPIPQPLLHSTAFPGGSSGGPTATPRPQPPRH